MLDTAMKVAAGMLYSGGLSALLSQRLVNVFAVTTSECPQIGTGTAGLDADQPHASLAVGAAGPLDRDKRRLRERELRHVTLRELAWSATPWSPIKPMAPWDHDNRRNAGYIDVEQLFAN